MASYFETFTGGCSTLIEDRLREAPFQTFVLLACTWMLSIPAILTIPCGSLLAIIRIRQCKTSSGMPDMWEHRCYRGSQYGAWVPRVKALRFGGKRHMALGHGWSLAWPGTGVRLLVSLIGHNLVYFFA
jgi:hypothetical protein